MFGQTKADIREILKTLYGYKKVEKELLASLSEDITQYGKYNRWVERECIEKNEDRLYIIL